MDFSFLYNNVAKLVKDVTIDIRKLELNPSDTVVINMNPVNGFFKEGPLSTPRLNNVIPKMIRVNEMFINSRKIFFCDKHSATSTELSTYPVHCATDREQMIISELVRYSDNQKIIEKNSTNGFFAKDYLAWLAKNQNNISNFIIVGGMTDISVMQFALSQKSQLNEINRQANVIVVENATQTFENNAHNGNQMHAFALYNMYINGIMIAQI